MFGAAGQVLVEQVVVLKLFRSPEWFLTVGTLQEGNHTVVFWRITSLPQVPSAGEEGNLGSALDLPK